ncbi:P-loop containing nucleoside triphosphate hydrolase protein [Mycena sp. CBHHK59/15]|nr:P-loop containing nucleoside triphosphate hydrolase protein [Mycena sp. CBHHK59/15]
MFQAGMGAEASYDHVLTSDYAVLLAEEFGRKPIVNDEAAFDLYPPPPHRNPATLPNRPPVVTIMGHVDHGKTTLLDTLRSSSVAKGEVGGITQHIGAFSVPIPSGNGAVGPQSITFLDTPGHAAFSAMRARGAHVTDIIVLVVAADDGIMPQTREVIELIKKDREKVGVVVAINKIDKPGCDVDAVQKALLVEDIHLEDLGGDTPSVEVSGLTGQGLPELVETLSLMAEIQDLRAEPEGMVFGYVLESKVVKGLGSIATVLVLRGYLKPGSHILSGVSHAKVRIMHDSNGATVKAASPGMAVTVSGWKTLPNAGDEVLQGTESEIKKAIANRQRKADIEISLLDVEAINNNRQQERERRQTEAEAEAAGEVAPTKQMEETPSGPKELRLLIKADVSGSAEAVEGALQGIGNHLAITKVISSGVGDILESDVMMAKTVGGVIVGFSVSSSRAVDTLAAQHDVPIITNNIIYRLMEDVKARVIKLLPLIIEYKVIGEAKVLQLFGIQVKGKQTKTVAGSRVINGLIEKSKQARVVRDGEIVFEGAFETMRHFKADVTELRKGNECGLALSGFDDLRTDDIIQTVERLEKPGLL